MAINFDTTSRVKACKNCGKRFRTKRGSQLYCGDECSKQVKKRKTEEYYIRHMTKGCKTEREKKARLEELEQKRKEKLERQNNKIPDSYGPKPYEYKHYQTRKTTKRSCLKCRKKFDSKGPGNRLCNECNQVNKNDSGPREYRVVVEKKRGVS